jgi:hypothetical protein
LNAPREAHRVCIEEVESSPVKLDGIVPIEAVLVVLSFSRQTNVFGKRSSTEVQVDILRLNDVEENLFKGLTRKLINKSAKRIEIRFLCQGFGSY